jgi:hypothetical protein
MVGIRRLRDCSQFGRAAETFASISPQLGCRFSANSFDRRVKNFSGSLSCSFIPSGPPTFANFLEVAFKKCQYFPPELANIV